MIAGGGVCRAMARPFGAQSEYGNLRKVLLSRPGPELQQVTFHQVKRFGFRDQVWWGGFLREWEALRTLLQGEGVEVIDVRTLVGEQVASGCFNMPYTRDSSIVTNEGAVILNAGLPTRAGESEALRMAYEKLGVPILGQIKDPGTVEGGGVSFLDPRTLLVAQCSRTNGRGIQQLRELLFKHNVVDTVLQLDVGRDQVHIDGAFLKVRSDLAICADHRLRGRPVLANLREGGSHQWPDLMAYLKEQKIVELVINEVEEYGMAANVLMLSTSKCIGYEWNERIAELLKDHGIELLPTAGAELSRGGGGPHCLTAPLLRDDP